MDGASRRGRMCWIASVCCCTAENCWAKPSTVSPNSPPWEILHQLLHQPRVGTTLVHLFERLGLVNLQDSHGVQGGGCLARSTVSFGRESGCQLTGLGRGDADGSSKWQDFVGTSAPRPLSPPGECPRTPWPLRRQE